MKKLLRVAYIMIVGLLLMCGTGYALPVVIPNPGAEKADADNASRPADVSWWTSANVDASFSRDTSVKRSGEASFHIVNRGRADASISAAQSALFIISGEVVPGLTYTVTGFVKTRDLTNDAGFSVRLKSSKGWLDSSPRCDVVKGTNDWTPITASFTAPAGATEFNLFLIVRYAGEAWFDDIAIHDNLKSWSEGKFAKLHETLTQRQSEAQALGGALPEEVLERLVAGAAQAKTLLAQSQQLSEASNLSLEARRYYVEEAAKLDRLILRYSRTLSVQRALQEDRAAAGGDVDFVAGFAPSTVHVFLQDCPVHIEITAEKKILAVRGETECTQLVILAHQKDITGVRISVSELAGDSDVIPAEAVVTKPVGFVRTEILAATNPYPREFDYLGWWPDPLLESFPFDVKKGDSQPVWIEVHVPRAIPAGIYRGTIRIACEDGAERTLGLAVEVADVLLPETWHFKNVLSWHEHWAKEFYQEQWNDAFQEKFFQFLLDRRINVLSIYGNEPYATPDNLIRFARRGQNLLIAAQIHPEARVIQSNAGSLRRRLDAVIPPIREAGFLDRCIVYGWDERSPEWHDEIRYGAQMLLKDYGGLPLMMAGVDATYGTDSSLSGLPNIIYCPTMPNYDPELAARAHANGNQVWWYETWWIIEDPLIRGRLIPWQTYKVDADGFLFWCLNRFVGNDKPVFDPQNPKIRTDWNPALDGGYENSTAMYVYPGTDGPISSLRLENFRDGMEDYELLVLARELLEDLAQRDGIDATVIEKLREATTIEDSFVKDHVDYSWDPAVLASHRRALIKAIEAAQAAS